MSQCEISIVLLLGKLLQQNLNLKFQQYTKDMKHTMTKHHFVMNDMIRDLRAVNVELIDEQHVLIIFHSLHNLKRFHMKFLMTNNENINIFTNIS